jgi:hypothetical protein
MPFDNNVFTTASSVLTITQHDHRAHLSSRLDSTAPYPPLDALVGRAQETGGPREAFPAYYHPDALFGFAVRLFTERFSPATSHRLDPVLRRLFVMGFDWREAEGPEQLSPGLGLRYSAVLGHELLRRIEKLEDQVGSYLFFV